MKLLTKKEGKKDRVGRLFPCESDPASTLLNGFYSKSGLAGFHNRGILDYTTSLGWKLIR